MSALLRQGMPRVLRHQLLSKSPPSCCSFAQTKRSTGTLPACCSLELSLNEGARTAGPRLLALINNTDLERYSRQILFSGLGEHGQQRLLESIAAVVGSGPIGAATAHVLARA